VDLGAAKHIAHWEKGGHAYLDYVQGITVDHTHNRVLVTDSHGINAFGLHDGLAHDPKIGVKGDYYDGDLHTPSGIAVDAEGRIVVTDMWLTSTRVQVFSPEGKFILKWGAHGEKDSQFRHPSAIALDKQGRAYVTDYELNRVQVFGPDGTFITKWGSEGSAEGEFDQPRGIAVNAEGNILVVDSKNHRIQVFSSDGAFIKTWGSRTETDRQRGGLAETDNGKFSDPTAIAVMADDNGEKIIVADGSRIQVFDSDGKYIAKWNSSATWIAVDRENRIFTAKYSGLYVEVYALNL